MAEDVKFTKAALLGVGLIGSSFARALRENTLAETIVGYDPNDAALERAKEIGFVDAVADSIAAAAAGADLIIIAAPVGAAADIIDALAVTKTDALIIDVGSVKGAIVDAAGAKGAELSIVPCHPIAGTEQSGPDAGFATLFHDRWCIITPLQGRDAAYAANVEKAVALWRAVGSRVEVMDARHHDLALAVTSHLPHLIAFTLVGAADDLEAVTEAEIVKYSAGGFRDFTRIAASDPVMWRDVFVANKDAVLEVLGRFTEELAVLQRAVRWGDAETLEKSFARGRALRRAIVDAGQETDEPNFGRDR
ncbi:MAG: prephenate/arogenate dehydrogenase family protein [Pseudomonadota bacterium]